MKRIPLNDLFEKGKQFLEELKPSDKIALIYHMDMDGICSAALMHKAFIKIVNEGKTKVKISKSVASTYNDIKKVFRELDEFNKIIIVDIGIDRIDDSRKILLIDHHLIKRDLNSDSVVYINPRFEYPHIYQPASYVVYKFLSTITDMKEFEWIAVLGIVCDFGYEDCVDVLKNWVAVKDKSDLFNTEFGSFGNLLLGASYVLGFDKVLDFLVKSNSLEELKDIKELSDAYKIYESAFNESKKEFWENAESFGNVIFSIIKPKYRRLSSPIINRISFENQDKMIFLLEKIDGKYKISARYQNAEKVGINLGELMRKCCNGGGHVAAAGGSIKIEDFKKFKECVLKELSSLSKHGA